MARGLRESLRKAELCVTEGLLPVPMGGPSESWLRRTWSPGVGARILRDNWLSARRKIFWHARCPPLHDASEATVRRRDIFGLLGATTASLLASCVVAPAAPTPVPAAATPVPTDRPTIPPAPTQVPTAAPTPVPTPVPPARPTLAPTPLPTAVPTAQTPLALAATGATAMETGIQRNVFPGGVALVRHRGA